MTRLIGYAYPWDVLGDPAFCDRVRALGLAEVALAATYHSARAATPLHPGHFVVEAADAALYRPVRDAAWAGRRLVPRPAGWLDEADPFAAAAGALRAAGLAVHAWIVLAHGTHLGLAHPEVAVRNCAGDSYPYALCPSHAEVREYAATLAAEAVRGVPVAGVSLEACGQLGFAHNGRHDKTAGVFPPAARTLLSVCCCAACRAAWAAAGADPDAAAAALADATRAVLRGAVHPDAPPEDLLGDGRAGLIRGVRQRYAARLRADVLAAVRAEAPAARVTLHARADPWATTPDVALGDDLDGIDAVLTSVWPTTDASRELLAATRTAVGDRAATAGYLTVLPPADPDRVVDHAGALRAAGAAELHLYHLGLAGPAGQRLLAEVVRRYGERRVTTG